MTTGTIFERRKVHLHNSYTLSTLNSSSDPIASPNQKTWGGFQKTAVRLTPLQEPSTHQRRGIAVMVNASPSRHLISPKPRSMLLATLCLERTMPAQRQATEPIEQAVPGRARSLMSWMTMSNDGYKRNFKQCGRTSRTVLSNSKRS